MAFRGHGRGPIEGGLCPHKWLPGSAVAHLPLIPTPGLTFASSFLSSPLPLTPHSSLSRSSLSFSLHLCVPPLPSSPNDFTPHLSLSLPLFLFFPSKPLPQPPPPPRGPSLASYYYGTRVHHGPPLTRGMGTLIYF